MSGWRVADERSASAHSALKEDKRQGTLLATLAGGSLAPATDFARQALSALVECSFRGSAFPTFPDVILPKLTLALKNIPDLTMCVIYKIVKIANQCTLAFQEVPAMMAQ